MKSRILSAFPILALVVLLLISLVGCQAQSSKQAKATVSAQEPVHFKAGDLEVVVAHPLPSKLPAMRLLEVREESINTDTVLTMFNFDKKVLRERNAPEIGGYQYIMDGPHNGQQYTESVTIKPNNHIVYQRDHRAKYNKRDPHLSEERAKEMVEDFIKAHGGLPEDAVLASISPSASDRVKHDSGVEEIIHQYTATYVSRTQDSYPIGGANRIWVLVDDEGVFMYDRFWRQPCGMVGKPLKLIDPKTAVIGALKLIVKSPSYYSDGLFSSGVVDLYKVELTYFSPEPWKHVKHLRPTYKISFLNSNNVVYADAITGNGINVGLNGPAINQDRNRILAAKHVEEFKEKYKIASKIPEQPPTSTHYTWAGGKIPTLPKEMPIHIREKESLSQEELSMLTELFGTKEPLSTSDPSFYEFGSAKKGDLKPGDDYTFETSKEGGSFTFKLVDWMHWSAKHPQLPDTEKAEAAAIAFLKPRGLLPEEVGVIEVSVDRAAYVQPTKELATAPAVWVHFQGKVDGYPTVDLDGGPDAYSWVTVGIGSGGKVLAAHGMLPAEPKPVVKPLRLIKDAIAEMNKARGSSNADFDHPRSGWAEPGFAVGPDLKRVKPKVFEYKITSVELAYQVRFSRFGERYVGPVYVFTIADTQNDRPNQITVPAARP
ncbi:MAG: hypothetical protein IBX64_04565 [Actinobacteria bacterium]|nr:hypothetical protein [Actinomycetota bacterium]